MGAVAIAVIVVILVLGGVAFVVYWFVIRPRQKGSDADPNTPKPASQTPGQDDYLDSNTSEHSRARSVSKPVLVEVNGEQVEEKSSDSDDTVEEYDPEDDYGEKN